MSNILSNTSIQSQSVNLIQKTTKSDTQSLQSNSISSHVPSLFQNASITGGTFNITIKVTGESSSKKRKRQDQLTESDEELRIASENNSDEEILIDSENYSDEELLIASQNY